MCLLKSDHVGGASLNAFAMKRKTPNVILLRQTENTFLNAKWTQSAGSLQLCPRRHFPTKILPDRWLCLTLMLYNFNSSYAAAKETFFHFYLILQLFTEVTLLQRRLQCHLPGAAIVILNQVTRHEEMTFSFPAAAKKKKKNYTREDKCIM